MPAPALAGAPGSRHGALGSGVMGVGVMGVMAHVTSEEAAGLMAHVTRRIATEEEEARRLGEMAGHRRRRLGV